MSEVLSAEAELENYNAFCSALDDIDGIRGDLFEAYLKVSHSHRVLASQLEEARTALRQIEIVCELEEYGPAVAAAQFASKALSKLSSSEGAA